MNQRNQFTERAEQALRLSHEAAAELGHSHVGSEHLLLGLLREGGGVAARALSAAGVTDEKIFSLIEEHIGRGESGSVTPQGLTPRTKRIIELSMAEAVHHGHRYVGTEHLLMGILRESDCFAARMLAASGVDAGALYRSILQMLGSQPEESGREDAYPGKSARNERGGATRTMDQYGTDLTKDAREGKLDPVIGRSEEIDRVIQILSRRTKNNPCLIGEPGVGKTAVAEGLAQLVASGDVPEGLRGKRVFSLELSGVVAGTKYRGEFEERVKQILDEVRKSGNVILFIDEIHTLVGAGAAEGAIDAANILKPMLARGEIQVIGATTLEEYRKHIEKDAALERRFQPVTVAEPSQEDSVAILMGLRDRYEAHHKLKISDEAIRAAVTLSTRYISDRYLPDKAIDLIDEAASRLRMKAQTAPPDVKSLEDEAAKLSKDMEEAIAAQNFEEAAGLRDRKAELTARIEAERAAWQEKQGAAATVTEEDVAKVVSGWTGVPVTRLTETESERLMKLEEELHRRVIGQDSAVSAVARAIRRSRVGLKDPKRPIGSFMFLGPTGVGKTELAKALAEAMFGDENAMMRVDMSEYMEKHTVSRLVGSPPGYVGHDEGGQLTEKVRRRPYSVILFDEVEKAHPDVFNIMLQILEDGILTDSQGRRVDFKNTIIIMTSNIGAHLITRERKTQSLGFSAEAAREDTFEEISESVLGELKRAFRPEFLNRVDEIIVFHRLERAEIRQIAALMLQDVTKRLAAMEVTLTWEEEALDRLTELGYDPVYGARPLRRVIQTQVEDRAAELLLTGGAARGDRVVLTLQDGSLAVKKEP
ncbi:MAG: ATP-dependent Clp protease ATP-binding subunit [Ruminococcaceae bacterium]|nr:ATP-dependent Clp protease ATP-binding subunit [Oscillospiraceae bacterium]